MATTRQPFTGYQNKGVIIYKGEAHGFPSQAGLLEFQQPDPEDPLNESAHRYMSNFGTEIVAFTHYTGVEGDLVNFSWGYSDCDGHFYAACVEPSKKAGSEKK